MKLLLFLMNVRANWMSLLKCEKYYYLTDISGYRLFKPNGIQSRLALSAQQTLSVLHSCHSQHFQSGAQRLSSDDISFHLRGEMRCVYVYELSLLTFLVSEFCLDRCENMIPVLTSQGVNFYSPTFPILQSLFCSQVKTMYVDFGTSQKQLWGI